MHYIETEDLGQAEGVPVEEGGGVDEDDGL